MNCEQCDTHLSALLDDELTSELKADVQRHVERCAACQSALDELQAVDQRLASLRLSSDAVARAIASIDGHTLPVSEPLSALTRRHGWKRTYFPWVLAMVAACIAIAIFVDPQPEAPQPIVGRLVRATGSVEVWLPGTDRWQPVDAEKGLAMQVGARVRTSPNGTCEIETVEKSRLRLDTSAELVLHAPSHVEVVKGQVWSRASDSATLQVDASPPDSNARDSGLASLLTMTCPSDSEFQWTVDTDFSACQSLSNSETQWNLAPFQCPSVGPGERVAVDTDRNVLRSKEDPLATKIWQLPLLAIGQAVDEELVRVVEPLLVSIGATKAGYLNEEQIRRLGPPGALPLLAYVQSAGSRQRAELRQSAMRIAADLADETAIGRLSQLRGDDDARIAEYAREALQRLE